MGGSEKPGAAEQVGAAVGRAADRVVNGAGQALGAVLKTPAVRRRPAASLRPPPGTAAGLELAARDEIHELPEVGAVVIRVMDYAEDRVEERLAQTVQETLPSSMPEWAAVRWIDVQGLHPYVIDQLRVAYNLHTLAAEDVLHVPQRPRVDPYDGHVFITVRMLQLLDGRLDSEQVSLFLLPRVVISFQERPGDVWDLIRQRIRLPQGKLRERDSSFLAYALLDAVVDHCYPLLERYGEVLEDLEDEAMDASTPEILRTIQGIRRELMTIRKALWPTRELLDVLIRGDAYALPAMTVTYLRDVHAHTVQLLDAVESHRELCGTLAELYMSVVSNRMNEVMKILTIIATLFIPITFIAGVYGMNFKYLPELEYRWGYGAFWAVCAAITAALLVFFRRKGWI